MKKIKSAIMVLVLSFLCMPTVSFAQTNVVVTNPYYWIELYLWELYNGIDHDTVNPIQEEKDKISNNIA